MKLTAIIDGQVCSWKVDAGIVRMGPSLVFYSEGSRIEVWSCNVETIELI